MQTFGKFISFVFHPIFIPILAFLGYLQIDHFTVSTLASLPDSAFWTVLAFVISFTIFLPLLGMSLMISSGIISDWHLREHKDRVPVIILSAVLMGILIYLFKGIEENSGGLFYEFFGVIFGGIVVSLITAVISYFWQISMHLSAISGLAGAMFALASVLHPIGNMAELIIVNSLILLAVGVTAVARLSLNAHSLLQVLAGMTVGFGVEFTIIVNGWYF